MKRTRNALLLAHLSSLLLLALPSHADEQAAAPSPAENAQGDHVSVGSRPMDPSKRQLMEEKRAAEAQEEQTHSDAPRRLQKIAYRLTHRGTEGFRLAPRASCASPKASFAAYYPVNCHSLVSLSMVGDSLEMEDGSHWKINSSDAYKVTAWVPGDQLVITPNTHWFSSYDYYVTNKRTGAYIKVDLLVGPLKYGSYSHWIIGMDRYSGHLFLENGTTWCVNPSDAYVFRDWEVNDHIILGVNDAWLTSYEHILINANMDNYVRSKQY